MPAIRPTPALAAILLSAALPLAAQTPTAGAAASAPVSAAKKELVAKLLQVQQPGLEAAARTLVERPAAAMMQQAAMVLQTQVAAERRETVGKALEADARKYVDDAYPAVRARAVELGPSTLGVGYEQKFSEEELRQLLAWFESPLNRKFQQIFPEIQNAYLQKLSAESRPLLEPRLQVLEKKVRAQLGLPADADKPAAAEPAPKPPARPASR